MIAPIQVARTHLSKILISSIKVCCCPNSPLIPRASSTKSAKCWKCGANRNVFDVFCESCKVIQNPAQTNNYFELFGIRPSYNIDSKSLTQKYRKLQSQLHPDKFTNKTDEEKRISETYSSLINDAYNVLQTPMTRATHLLRLHNETIGEDDKVSDPSFLAEIMELNEEVEEAKTPEELKALDVNNRKKLEEIGREMTQRFDENRIDDAKACAVKMKYYNSLSKRINELLRERGIVD